MAKDGEATKPASMTRGSKVERAAFERSKEKGRPDYGFVALAIGRWAHRRQSIPQWALDACADLYERSERSTRMLVRSALGPGANPKDAERLESIADLFIDYQLRTAAGLPEKPSVRAVVLTVLGGSSIAEDADMQRLQRLWRTEGERRKDRARERLHKKLRDRGVL